MTQITIHTVLTGAYTADGRYDDLEKQVVHTPCLVCLVRLLCVRWTFCGMGSGFVELERDGRIATINMESGEVTVA